MDLRSNRWLRLMLVSAVALGTGRSFAQQTPADGQSTPPALPNIATPASTTVPAPMKAPPSAALSDPFQQTPASLPAGTQLPAEKSGSGPNWIQRLIGSAATPSDAQNSPANAPPVAPVPGPYRDPFSTSEAMELRSQQMGMGPAVAGVAGPRQAVPAMHLQGIAADDDGSSVALLSVGDKDVYFVREGEKLTVAANGQGISLDIEEIPVNGRYVKVKVGDEFMLVR